MTQTAQVNPPGPSAVHGRSRWPAWIVVAIAVAAAIGTTVGLILAGGGRTGDPGGRILRALSSVPHALPADAAVITRSSSEPHWDDCHSDHYTCTTPGWTLVDVEVQFSTRSAAVDLLRHAGSVLAAQGWCLSRQAPTPLGPAWTWARMVPGGGWAWASLSPGDSGPGTPLTWDLQASAPASGARAAVSPLSDPPCPSAQP